MKILLRKRQIFSSFKPLHEITLDVIIVLNSSFPTLQISGNRTVKKWNDDLFNDLFQAFIRFFFKGKKPTPLSLSLSLFIQKRKFQEIPLPSPNEETSISSPGTGFYLEGGLSRHDGGSGCFLRAFFNRRSPQWRFLTDASHAEDRPIDNSTLIFLCCNVRAFEYSVHLCTFTFHVNV